MSKETIAEFVAGERLDKTLAVLYPEYSRSALEKLITNGAVTVNGESAKTKYMLKETDEVIIDFEALSRATEQIEIPILYEDENVVVINKPVGILAHTKGAFSKEGTVASWLKTYYIRIVPLAGTIPDTKFWDSNRAGIVHRLDRGTTGVMICAKNEEAQIHLQKQFAKRNVKKTYVAVIAGELSEPEGLIDVPIERNPKKPATFRVGVNGKAAQTHFKVLKTNGKYSLVELKPHTGRTHQLRVHLTYLKHPIVGDEFYQGEVAQRLLLHAKELEITLPGSQRKTFTADIPEIFNTYLK